MIYRFLQSLAFVKGRQAVGFRRQLKAHHVRAHCITLSFVQDLKYKSALSHHGILLWFFLHLRTNHCFLISDEKTIHFLPFNMCALATNGSSFKHITVKSLHPTFGAEISGVDFSKPVADEVFDEIRAAARKVSLHTDFL